MRRFSERWGLTPALTLTLLLEIDDPSVKRILKEKSSDIQIWETSTSVTVRIPKPVTESRLTAANQMVAEAQFEVGPMEFGVIR